MKLTDILVREACLIDLQARTKKEALRDLADSIASVTKGLEPKELLDLLLEREKLGSTAMGDGIAIPHARIEALDRLVASFGRSRHGLDFEALDEKPTHLFFLLVAPGKEGSTHLLTLARLSRLLSNEEFRARLLDVDTVDELFRAIEEEESRQ